MTPGKHCSHSGLALPEFRYELPTTRERAMIFRQLFDSVSSTYSYLIANRRGGEALIIDPVLEKVDRYIQLVKELDLKLVKAVDTHVHADHITGLGALRDRTHCITVMGEHSRVDVVSMRVADGDQLQIEGVNLDVLYTPGHTDDSYSFLMGDRVFTGDTLLIRGTGRTDFQPGGMLYELAAATGKRMVFYCAFGERSAMAVEAARQAGLAATLHIQGGLDAWKKANGPLTR